MNKKKSSTRLSIGLLKENLDICAAILTKKLSLCNSDGIFPNKLKVAYITPFFKSAYSTAKKNYRPISILNSLSKLFEKLIKRQLDQYFNKKLSDHLCGCRKGYTTQYKFLELIENWKKFRDEKIYSAAILMDLFEALHAINHALLIVKLHAYDSLIFFKVDISYIKYHEAHQKSNFCSSYYVTESHDTSILRIFEPFL